MTRRMLAIAAALALTLISAFTLSSLVVPGLWFGRTLLCVGIATAVVAVARSRTASASLPTLLGLLAGALTISAVFFGEHALLRILPTRATVEAVVDLVPATLQQMRGTYPPIEHGEGVSFFVATGVLLVLLLTELLAVGAWAPAWAGLPVLGLWAVPVTLGAPVSVAVVLLAGVAYATLIVIQARDDGRFRRRRDGRALRASGVVVAVSVVAALVVAPALLRLPAPVRWHPYYELVGSSTTRLSLGLDLRDDLLQGAETPLFSYTGTAADDVGPLHAYTVSEFTGSEWVRGNAGDLTPLEDQLLWPTAIDDAMLGNAYELDMTIYSLGQDRLLLPGEPRTLDLAAPADYAAELDEVITHIGDQVSYSMTVVPRVLDQESLESLQAAADVPAELLAVPDTGYQSDIADLARQIVDDAGASTPYEQVLAIQNYLRDPSLFVYSTSIASPRTPDAVWDFLQDKHGYCVQFATAMVMLVRSLGLPARMAVGFLPGTTGPDGVTEVTADKAHAWPQVLFEGVGWVRFEPTPGVQAGEPPEYAPEPVAGDTETTTAASDQPSASADDPTTDATTTSGTSTSGTDADSARGPWLAVLVLLALLAAVGAALGRRQARRRGVDLRERWQRVLAHLERVGIDTAPTRTPRAVVRDAEPILDEHAIAALRNLAGTVETVSYGLPGTPRPQDAQVEQWVQDVLEGARAVQRDQQRTGAATASGSG